jgi:geranylgeranyl reductase family protein
VAARALALAGRDVLLVDRSGFPRDKPCGDAVPGHCVSLLKMLGLAERVEEARFHPVRRVLHVHDDGTTTRVPLPPDPLGLSDSCVVPRTKLDAVTWQGAVDAGASFLVANVSDVVVEGGQVVGVCVGGDAPKVIRSRVVVGADGSTSVVGRRLRTSSPGPEHRGVSLRAYVDGMDLEDDTMEFHAFRGSYAWVFPVGGGRANVGVGFRLDTQTRLRLDLRALLEEFLGLPHVACRLHGVALTAARAWPVNMGSADFNRAFHGALLVGDAGWFADPLTGGGIQNAVVSALMAARVVDGALRTGDCSRRTLVRYDLTWRQRLWPDLCQAAQASRAMHAAVYGAP